MSMTRRISARLALMAAILMLAIPAAGSAAVDEETYFGVGGVYFNDETVSTWASGDLVQSVRVDLATGPQVQTLSQQVCAGVAVNATGDFDEGCAQGTVLIDPTLSFGIVEAIIPVGGGETITVAFTIQGTGLPEVLEMSPPDRIQYFRLGQAVGTVQSTRLGGPVDAHSDFAVMNGAVNLRDYSVS